MIPVAVSQRLVIASLALSLCFAAYYSLVKQYSALAPSSLPFTIQAPAEAGSTPFRDKRVACRGLRGVPLGDAQDDELKDRIPSVSVPQPYAGSYPELGLGHTWSTAKERYSPYGFGQSATAPAEEEVDWSKIDWAELRNECLRSNVEPGLEDDLILLDPKRRMHMPNWRERANWFASRAPARPKTTTGRTAILVRGWSTFELKEEDYLNLRALITETSLQYKGQYTVILLVDVKGDYDVMRNPRQYDEILESIPREFRNMTVLFDQHNFLRAWYPLVKEHRPEWQMEQARQVFAHHFEEFDHYWTIELDLRFSGHAGRMLNALETFGKKEPRKQSRERSSFFFTPVYGTYQNLTNLVDQALNGASSYWKGVPIQDIQQAGPHPPTESPEDDKFDWGVGEEADVILLSSTFNITLSGHWHYQNWIGGFSQGVTTPRIASAPAVSRCSWNLLNEMHQAQVWQGLAVPSEATPASFALWHNFKISRPPFPIYGEFADQYSETQIDTFLNGGPPSSDHDGMAWGRNAYGKMFEQDDGVDNLGATWRWNPGYPADLMRIWMDGDVEAAEKLPTMLVHEGQVMMPNLMLHPVKSNPKPSANPP